MCRKNTREREREVRGERGRERQRDSFSACAAPRSRAIVYSICCYYCVLPLSRLPLSLYLSRTREKTSERAAGRAATTRYNACARSHIHVYIPTSYPQLIYLKKKNDTARRSERHTYTRATACLPLPKNHTDFRRPRARVT